MALEQLKEPATAIDFATVSVPGGGVIAVPRKGAQFQAAFNIDQSAEARVAHAERGIEIYTIIVSKNIPLTRGAIIERDNKKIFIRLTNDGIPTPNPATVDEVMYSAVLIDDPFVKR